MNKLAHLQMIQGVVNRLSHDSFLLKGWSVLLVSALFALSAKDSAVFFVYLAYLPALMFWGLDGYFLRQERLFRKLYGYVSGLAEDEIDFSMDRSEVSKEVAGWEGVVLSKTIVAFHGTIIISIIVVTAISLFRQ